VISLQSPWPPFSPFQKIRATLLSDASYVCAGRHESKRIQFHSHEGLWPRPAEVTWVGRSHLAALSGNNPKAWDPPALLLARGRAAYFTKNYSPRTITCSNEDGHSYAIRTSKDVASQQASMLAGMLLSPHLELAHRTAKQAAITWKSYHQFPHLRRLAADQNNTSS
jgi:hypothetical protein